MSTRLHAIDYDASRAIIEANGKFVIIDTEKNDVVSVADELPITASGSYMKVAPYVDHPTAWNELADAATTELDIAVDTETAPVERKFRVPNSVKQEVRRAVEWSNERGESFSPISRAVAHKLLNDPYVYSADVIRLQKFFGRLPYRAADLSGWSSDSEGYPSEGRVKYGMRGGQAGEAWVNKIRAKHPVTAAAPELEKDDVNPRKPHEFVADPDLKGLCGVCGKEAKDPIHTITASAFEYDGSCKYFGHGVDLETTLVDELYVLSPDGSWAIRENNDWTPVEPPEDGGSLILLDEDSAYVLADVIDDGLPDNPDALPYELGLINSHEAALFALAKDEIDWEMIDRVFDIYDSTERSVNAKSQVRGPGGKFGDSPDAPDAKTTGEAPTKARLPQALPLVTDPASLIADYLAKNGVTQDAPAPTESPEPGMTAAYLNSLIDALAEGDPVATPATSPAGTPTPLYMAIVDRVDTEAVLDVVSLMAGPPPVMWKRDAGKWVQAPEILAAMQGSAPPPVVELTDPTTVQNVLEQVDASTGGGQDEADPAETPAPTQQAPDGSSGAKPDANPDQHPVPAQASIEDIYADTAMGRAELAAHGSHPCQCKGCDEFDCGQDACACCWVYDDNDVLVRDENPREVDNPEFKATSSDEFKKCPRCGSNMVKDLQNDKQPKCAKCGYHVPLKEHALRPSPLIPATKGHADFTLWGTNGELLNLDKFAGEGGADRNRGGAEQLRDYWEHGEGGVKIGWNTPGDMTRCMKFLSKYLRGREAGYCALRHHAMTGLWPGDKKNK